MAVRARRRSVIVVGSGIAGLTTALRASTTHEVLLVSGGALEESNTLYAQGGIAGALGPRDSVEAHVSDTLGAGAGLCDERAVRVLCAEAPARLRELVALGVPFDRLADGRLALGLEAAHSVPRILHAGGDATGAAIERTLVSIVRDRVAHVMEGTTVTDLIVDGGVVTGVRTTGPDGAGAVTADSVVLATGGFAALYAHSSNPPAAVGTGIAVAARAGAAVADLEFVQFHPTVLAGGLTGSPSFLISEAVRGEGAVLRDENGERFLVGVHPDAELAPRDVVARAIAVTMARQGGRPVLLDATGIDAARLDARFPGIAERLRRTGIDWSRDPVPVTPAAHYTMGGIATDLDGRTTVPGLYAVGEVARTGVHGANRLASNSLVEGAVFGARVSAALSADAGRDIALALPAGPPVSVAAPAEAGSALESVPAPELGALLWDAVGLVRSESGLTRALDGIRDLARSGGQGRDALLVATLLTSAALERRESRGAHARADHPQTDPASARPLFLTVAASGRDVSDGSSPASRHQPEAIAC